MIALKMIMNAEQKQIGWSRRYQAALRRYVMLGPTASLQPALKLGRQAVSLGLETLDLALIHEQSLITLASPGPAGLSLTGKKMSERAKKFFIETIVPIEKTHLAALKADVDVKLLTRTLRRRTVESSASTRHLERGLARRQGAEAALKKSGKLRIGLVQESSRLHKRLRHQTREMLSAHEDERLKTSRQLNDEIAQTLLAINIRLLALKTSGMTSKEKLEKEIADTQRLVQQSIKKMHRIAHKFGVHHET